MTLLKKQAIGFLFLITLSACSSPARVATQTQPQPSEDPRYASTHGVKGMVVSDDRISSEWGAQILRMGGNAVDAAVATGFALAVTRPHYAALGGGGFMVYCRQAGACHALDYREMAPLAAHRDFYIRDGKPRTDLSQDGALAPGVPGVPAGLLEAHARFGSLPIKTLLRLPLELAKKGFPLSGGGAEAIEYRWEALNPEAQKIFGCLKKACRPGAVIKQADLARVLEEIQRRGPDGFYKGWVAKKISQGIHQGGGVISEADLAGYRPVWRDPVRGTFKGFEVVSMPPPSSGGIHLLQMLGFTELAIEQGQLAQGYGSVSTIHAMTHAMSLAFADRTRYLGDPDFYQVPSKQLLDKNYILDRWKSFRPKQAALPEAPGVVPIGEPKHTTHFSVIDRAGNAVAITTTVNNELGSGFIPPGTGVVMNDQMDDFSLQPGVANLFGLIGAEANAVAPKKRPLSSMTPTIVRDSKGMNRIVLGAQGGPRIITAVFHTLVNRLEFGMNLADAVHLGRFHHQWRPKELVIERYTVSPMVQEKLKEMGYSLKSTDGVGRLAALERFENGEVIGVSDRRTEGEAVAE